MILIAAVLAISLISLAAIKMTQKDGKEVIVTVDGKEVYKTSIKKDQIYQIPEKNGTNVMQIKDGKVTMKKQTVKTRSVQTIKQLRNQEKRSYVCHIK